MNQQEWNHCKTNFCVSDRRWRTLGIIMFDAGTLFAAFYLQSMGSLFILPGILLFAFVFLHAYLLLHEATHSAVSHSKFLNNLVGHICGWMILMPFLARQRSHLLHHIWTGHPIGDPANKRLIQRFSVINQKQKRTLEWIWGSWIPLFTLNDRIGLWRDAFQERKNVNKSKRIIKEIQWVCLYGFAYVLFVGVLIQQGVFLEFIRFYFPALIIQFFLEELTNSPHHAESPLIGEKDKPLPYWEQDKVTHSCKNIPIWSKYVILNFNLHTAHHFYPWAPWYQLPQLHQEMIKIDPRIEDDRTQHEISWALEKRKKPLLSIMAHYFDKIGANTK
jgi:acyl-lipid omega-6 desaturase (Delta-12 desaturase)